MRSERRTPPRPLPKQSRALAALLVVAAALALALSLPGCSEASPDAVSSPCPPGQTCSVRLTLLHTSDIHSRLFPFEQVITQIDSDLGLGQLNEVANIGGVARMAYVIGRERARADRLLHLDSGDCFQGAPVYNFFAGEPEIRALSSLGIDAAVVGNHEFDRGLNALVTQTSKWANYSLLIANYKYEGQVGFDIPNLGRLATVTRPFKVFNREGLKVGVIGMGNLSSLTSIFDQPNRLGITPLNTPEVAQFYIDMLRPHVDLIVMLTHLGLEVDQRMVRATTGIDVVLGGHNHIVINPPQQITDCAADPINPGFVWTVDPNLTIDPGAEPPKDALHPDPIDHPWQFKRTCKPRQVIIAHSGAFAKYVGRLDLIVTNDPKQASPTGDPVDYEPVNGFEVASHRYVAFPIDSSVPEDPIVKQLLEPYQRTLDNTADLDILVGFSPNGARRVSAQGGDSPLGNMVATAMWLRLGIQTDFSLTNTTGIRADINPGALTIEQMYNVFPFDNSISKMQLSGAEVQQLFDFVARRSSRRGCTAQSQIAGARVRINCSGCARPGVNDAPCTVDADCLEGATCEAGKCKVEACADSVYIGHIQNADGTRVLCRNDQECPDKLPGQCDRSRSDVGLCLSPIRPTNLYELATSNYLAGGGSGFRVLQRNTTQFDTKVQQRDALIDYLRAGKPCGYDKNAGTPEGLKACSTDQDCGVAGFVCACPGHAKDNGGTRDTLTCTTDGACGSDGRCVRADCRESVARFQMTRCATTPELASCRNQLQPCSLGGESCKFLACIDQSLGNFSDARLEMIGR
ncbi:MAG: bifunctional metallophosphatase/5'-nucleotidase [Myxococcales bacterium]|jgi:5'-nucleotidase|nr:bifunctional metallophosphatase/5'-nucleotidase [Myxococcales bacterium]